MDKFQLSYLAAKDYLVARHKWDIRYWSLDEWRMEVDSVAHTLRHSTDTSWMEPYNG